jgi:hypothetical protein
MEACRGGISGEGVPYGKDRDEHDKDPENRYCPSILADYNPIVTEIASFLLLEKKISVVDGLE